MIPKITRKIKRLFFTKKDSSSSYIPNCCSVIFDDYWTGDLAKYAWKNKSHWDEPERMDIVGAYAELESRDDFYKKVTKDNLIPRAGKAEEVSQAILFAIQNDFITGTTIDVDGGWILA